MLDLFQYIHNSLSFSHIWDRLHFIIPHIQFLFGGLKSCKSRLNVLHLYGQL